MAKKSITLAAIAITALVVSCQKKEKTETTAPEPTAKTYALIDKASWLVGEWGNTSKEGVLTETWTRLNDSTLTAQTYFVTGKDTVHTESVVLEQKMDSLFYIPTVKNQNDGKPVTFKLTSSTDQLLVFENPKHDFPQKITYNKVTNDSLVAAISGMKNGKESKESYPMKKKS